MSEIAVFGLPTWSETCLGIKFFGKTFTSVLYIYAFAADFLHLMLPWKILGHILIIATTSSSLDISVFFIL